MTLTKEQAKNEIKQLIAKYHALSADGKKELTEATVVRQFIDPLLAALGWPIGDPAHYQYEQHTIAGRPDMMLTLNDGQRIFVEAKKFGKIQKLAVAPNTLSDIVTPGQMVLPSMAADRTAEEQQAINYAFKNDGKWAILANFERLRLFNARRDWLVLSFEEPFSYLADFDHLWQLSYGNISAGGLDVLSSQRVRVDVDTDYLNFINEWRQRLAQNIVDRAAQNGWAFNADGSLRLADLRAVVQRVLDRMVIIRYAEDHLIAPAGMLNDILEVTRTNLYTFPLTQHLQQIFRGFDGRHNSALFAPHLADKADFDNNTLDGLIEKLYEARYRAMTPDIMGNTYEQYLGKALVVENQNLKDLPQITTRDNLETRKKQGSYYTPQVIVRYIVDNSLGRYLYGTVNGRFDGTPLDNEGRKTYDQIGDLRLIDPACGSGGFLIYAYGLLADFYRSEIERITEERVARYDELVASGMTVPFDLEVQLTPYTVALENLRNYPRLILEKHLYGSDLDPQAAEIATVNLIMRAMADQRDTEKRLPLILNQNVKVGNALIGAGPNDPRYADHADKLAELRRLRLHLVSGQNGKSHTAELAQIEALTAELDAALNVDLAGYFAQKEEVPVTSSTTSWENHVRPLHWAVAFPELFVDEAGQLLGDEGGFTIVMGNPPWEVIQPDLREFYAQFDDQIESKLTRKQVETRIDELNKENPIRAEEYEKQTAQIKQMAAYFKKSGAFSKQGKGKSNTQNLFLERGYQLLTSLGRMGFVIPSGIYSDLGTKDLRQMFLQSGQVEYLYNFSNERFFFSGVHHSFKFTLFGAQKNITSKEFWAAFRFNPRVAVAPRELAAFLADKTNLILVRAASLERFSPDSLSLMEFQTQKDYDVAEQIYGDWPLIGEELKSSWYVKCTQEFNMTTNRNLFKPQSEGLPLYEGKMIHQYQSDLAPARFWIKLDDGTKKLNNTIASDWFKGYRFAYRAIARATDERTLIATILPKNNFTGHSIWVGETYDPYTNLYFIAIFNSFCLDWLARFRVNTNVTLFVIKQLPIPRLTAGAPHFDAIVPRAAALTCTTAVFADLWESVMGTDWDESVGATETAVRQQLRDELDAIIAHLYGLNRDDFAHILTTFPLVFPDTPAGAAKKKTLLTVYDDMATVFGE